MNAQLNRRITNAVCEHTFIWSQKKKINVVDKNTLINHEQYRTGKIFAKNLNFEVFQWTSTKLRGRKIMSIDFSRLSIFHLNGLTQSTFIWKYYLDFLKQTVIPKKHSNQREQVFHIPSKEHISNSTPSFHVTPKSKIIQMYRYTSSYLLSRYPYV